MIHIQGIDHVVLRVANMARALAFYGEVLGCQVEKRQDALGLVQLRAGASLIDLVDLSGKLGRAGGAGAGPEGRNMDHFCLAIDPWDETALRAHLATCGVDAGATAPRYGAQGEGPSIYIADPDGNTVELQGPGT